MHFDSWRSSRWVGRVVAACTLVAASGCSLERCGVTERPGPATQAPAPVQRRLPDGAVEVQLAPLQPLQINPVFMRPTLMLSNPDASAR